MSIHPPPQLLSLQRYEARILEDAVGTLVACLSGCVWLTQHGDSRDIILHAGDSFRIERPGCVVMAAGRPTRLHLVAPPAEASSRRASRPSAESPLAPQAERAAAKEPRRKMRPKAPSSWSA